MISNSVQDFCKQYGLSGVSMEEGGKLNLSIDAIGEFQLLHKAPHFLTGLSRKVENLYLLSGRKVLACSHFREERMSPLHAQLHGDKLGLYYIFEEKQINPVLLSAALDSLTETMDKIFQDL